MSPYLKTACAGLLAVSLIPAAGQAANENNSIIVTATRLDDDSRQTGYVTVITADDIAASAAATLAEILATEAGVLSRSLYGNHAARATIDMRGFGAAAKQNTLVLLDGRRLNDIDLSAVDFAAIPLSGIERIEIIRGGGSVLYGDGASGGVINIISKQPGDTVSDISVSGGSYQQRQLDISTAAKLGKSGITATLSSTASDGYRDNNDLTQHNLMLGLRTPLQNGEWFVKFGYDKQELGLPGVRIVDPGSSINELDSDRTGTATPLDYADQEGLNFTAGITRFLSDNVELVFDIGYRSKNQQAFFDYGGGFSDYLDSDLVTWSVTPRLTLDHSLAGLESSTTIGVDVYLSDYDSDRALNPAAIATPIHRLAIEQDSQALYISNETHLSGQTSLSAGARLQCVGQSATDRYDATAPGGAFDSEAPAYSQDERETLWQLGFRHQLNDAVSLFTNLERAVRFATVDELYEYDAFFQRVFSPLQPQTADQLNIGLDYTTGDTTLGSNVYFMDLDNEIHFDPVTFTNVNLDPTRRRGLELAMRRAISAGLDISASYTWMEAEFRNGGYAGNTVPLVPRNSASLSALWRAGHNAVVSARLNYVGNRYFDNDQSNTFGEKIPAATTLDLKLSWTRQQWIVTGLINNALNEDYFDYGVSSTTTAGKYNAYPNPERNFNLMVKRQF